MARPPAPSGTVFISYAHDDRDVAEAVAEALEDRNIKWVADWATRPSLRRMLGIRRGARGEGGLDSWLRSRLLWSDYVLALVSQAEFLSSFHISSADSNRPFLDLLVYEPSALKLYRDASLGYYFSNPRRWWQNEYYAWFLGTRIGKDRLERWRHWEMRVSKAIGLPRIVAVIGEEDYPGSSIDDLIRTGIQQSRIDPELFSGISFANICLLRRLALEADVSERCVPTLTAAMNGSSESRLRWKLRFALARLMSPLAAITFVVFMFLAFVVLDIVHVLGAGLRWIYRTVFRH